MNHLRFDNNRRKTVCMNPDLLGFSTVTKDTYRHEHDCRECSQLLLAHNVKEALKESEEEDDRPELMAKGCSWALLLSIPIWIIAIGLFLFWATRG